MAEKDPVQDLSIGFLEKSMAKLESAMTAGFLQIHTKIDILTEHYVRRDEMDRAISRLKEGQIDPLKTAIEEIKDTNKWLARTVAGILIGIAITAIYIKANN